jgi:signal transduction histidine kinase/ligand-binding sensor domain-containing protein
MWKFFCKSVFVVSVTLISGLISQGSTAAARPQFQDLRDFYHTAWNGLGAVFDIKQSSEGYLWLTTSRGVLRFDGIQFQSVGEVTRGAAPTGEIDSVFLASSGGLWLTTQGAGLLFWKDGNLTTFPDRRCTPARKQGQLIEDRDGSLWVQATAGLFHLRGSVCEQVGIGQDYPGGFPAGLLMDSDGTLWVKTRTGPLLFLPRGHTKFQVSKYGEGVSSGYAYLREGPDGTIWLSDGQGLRQVASKLSAPASSVQRKAYQGNAQFGDFTFGPDSSLWAVTNKGVQRFDHVERWQTPVAAEAAPGESFTPKQGLSSDAVWKVLVDRDGVWVATNAGLDRLRRATFTRVRLPQAQEHEFSVAAGDKGSVWTGNSSLPLTHLTADGAMTSFPSTRQTISVRRDHNGTIWSAGAGEFHLWRLSGKGLSPLRYPDDNLDPVVFVATDRNNDPWITTISGKAYRLSGRAWSNQTAALGKKPGVVGAMVDDQAGNVWFAFSNKVVEWDGQTYHRFSFPNGQRGVSENTMSVRGDHVWLGGAGGVQLFTRGQFYLMRWKDPDLPGRVSGIVETPTGDLWVNGFSGVVHVSASELKNWLHDPGWRVSGERFDELDGLPGLSGETLPEPSLVEAPDGRLWFATIKGIAWLDPTTVENNRHRLPPSVVVSAIASNGKRYAAANGLTLPAHTENLEVDYTALALPIPERARFRYKLERVDKDWQDAGTRRAAFFSNLGPGNYKFRVIASNNDGVWNDAGASLDFSIAPAPYQTTWFRLLCVAAFLGLIAALHQLRLHQLQRQFNIGLEARVSERTRIARELHDTLLQSFHGLMLSFQAVSNLLPTRAEEAKRRLDDAIDQAAQAITEGRDAVQGLRSSTIETYDLTTALNTLAEELAANKTDQNSTVFDVHAEGTPRDLHPILRDEVYRIAGEALRNAFRHAQARRIEMEIHYGERQLRLRIRDNGKGMDSQVVTDKGRRGHWGLHGMWERAKVIGGDLEIWSKVQSGTEIELTIPASTAYVTSTAQRRSWFSKKGTAVNS